VPGIFGRFSIFFSMTIIFDIFPSYGHHHATFKLAKVLKDVGHKIYYIGQYPYFKNLPSDISRRYINPYIFSFIERETNNILKNIRIAFKEKQNHKKYAFYQQTIKQYDELISKIKPDLIIVDHHYIQKAVLYYKYQIPIVSVQTTLASEMNLPIPPLNSTCIPKHNILSNLYALYLWNSYLLIKRIRLFIYKIIFFSENHLSDVMRLAKKTGYPIKKNIDYKHYKSFGGFGLKNIPQLLLSPFDFDFPHKLNKNQYAVGPLLLKEDDVKIRDRRYLSVLNRIKEEKKGGTIAFIYCSLGTLNNLGLKKSIKILQYVIETGKRNPEFRIVITVGEFINPAVLLPTPDNVFLFKSIPQKNILRFCDMMIAHGGLNSITECVMNEVPMLIYPFYKKSDLGGNSARVVYHSIGNRGFIKKDTVDIMDSKIKDVLYNPVYRKNIHLMRLKFEEKNNATEIISIIESIVKNYHSTI